MAFSSGALFISLSLFSNSGPSGIYIRPVSEHKPSSVFLSLSGLFTKELYLGTFLHKIVVPDITAPDLIDPSAGFNNLKFVLEPSLLLNLR